MILKIIFNLLSKIFKIEFKVRIFDNITIIGDKTYSSEEFLALIRNYLGK